MLNALALTIGTVCFLLTQCITSLLVSMMVVLIVNYVDAQLKYIRLP